MPRVSKTKQAVATAVAAPVKPARKSRIKKQSNRDLIESMFSNTYSVIKNSCSDSKAPF